MRKKIFVYEIGWTLRIMKLEGDECLQHRKNSLKRLTEYYLQISNHNITAFDQPNAAS